MATPSLRTKILVARGTYSNLNASVSDLGEGEICYATDQDKLYVKEGGVLTGIGGDVVSVNGQTGTVSLNIDNLTDVDTTTVAPTSGQLLSYDGAQWTPTDAPVPVAGSDTQVQFNDTGVLSGDTGLTFDATTNELTVGVSNADPGTATVKGDLNLDSGGNFSTTIQSVTPTANRTISFPDKTGTVGLVSGATGNIQYNNAGQLAGTSDFNVDLNWTNASVNYTGLKINVTNTASDPSSRYIKFDVNNTNEIEFYESGIFKRLYVRSASLICNAAGAQFDNVFGGVRINSNKAVNWNNQANTLGGAPDCGLKRDSAGVIAVTDGSTGTGYLKQTPILFANLAAMPNAAYDGARVMISDGPASPTFGGTASGGGTRTLPVFSDGTNWYFG